MFTGKPETLQALRDARSPPDGPVIDSPARGDQAMVRRRGHVLGLALVVGIASSSVRRHRGPRPPTRFPTRLTDAEFWRLSEELSEPGGYFRSDNLLSNELYYPEVLPGLVERVKPGGVYLGVGPEQNFNYIVADPSRRWCSSPTCGGATCTRS